MGDIFLTGPKHSGKTSAGRALAKLCRCEFIDLDKFIEQRSGKSPRELYSESQTLFQKAEAEAIAALSEPGGGGKKLRVIAAGGGIIDNDEAVALLKKPDAVTVYLAISAQSAWQRIARAAKKELPPFLRTDNPQETHRILHERRAAAYLQLADIVIEAEGKSVKKNAAEILSQLKKKYQPLLLS